MHPSLSFPLGRMLLLRFSLNRHRTQTPLPDPDDLIHLQVLGHGMGDEDHAHLALELVDGGGEVFGGGLVQAAGEQMGSASQLYSLN